jgi:hypothetical protein
MTISKTLVLSILLIITFCGLSAQAPNWMWAKQAGATGYDYGYDIATDLSGNSYVCGSFMGTASFGTFSLTSNSASMDIFVAKLDSSGNWLWAIQAGGPTDDWGRGIAVDNGGNVYLTGSFTGTATFGTTTLSNNGYPDIVVAKIGNQGNWIWANKAGGDAEDEGWDIAVDASGNSYITGYFRATAHFGANQMDSNNFTFDVCVAKISATGDWVWAQAGGGNGSDTGYGIALDNAGNAYVTGDFEGSATFGGIPIATYGAQRDIFVGQIATSGTWLWIEHAGGVSYDTGTAIAADSSGNSYITGFYSGTATFGSHSLTGNADSQIFVAKLDNTGFWTWAQQPGGSVYGVGNSIDLDDNGNIYIAGSFTGTPSFGSVNLTSSGVLDVFAAKMDTSGNWLWGQKGGGSGNDNGEGIAVDISGYSYVTGTFSGYASFGATSYNYFGFSDIFVAKLALNGVAVDDNTNPPPLVSALIASPNPFRNSTSIQIKIASQDAGAINAIEEGNVAVYDLRGRLVKVLISKGLPSGTTLAWDGKDMNGTLCRSGVYFVKYSLPGSQDLITRISLIN